MLAPQPLGEEIARMNACWQCAGEPNPRPRPQGLLWGWATFCCSAAMLLGLLGCHSDHTISLFWNPSTSVVVGYNVYRGTHPGGPYKRLNSSPVAASAYTDSTIQSGQTYFYVVKSVDWKNLESVPSAEVSYAIPVNRYFIRISELIRKFSPKKLQSENKQPR